MIRRNRLIFIEFQTKNVSTVNKNFLLLYYFYHNCLIIKYWSTMVFYIIGLGLGDPEDISLKAVRVIKSCKEVYLEYYTSVMSSSNADL